VSRMISPPGTGAEDRFPPVRTWDEISRGVPRGYDERGNVPVSGLTNTQIAYLLARRVRESRELAADEAARKLAEQVLAGRPDLAGPLADRVIELVGAAGCGGTR
jgi:hypothetical protein